MNALLRGIDDSGGAAMAGTPSHLPSLVICH